MLYFHFKIVKTNEKNFQNKLHNQNILNKKTEIPLVCSQNSTTGIGVETNLIPFISIMEADI